MIGLTNLNLFFVPSFCLIAFVPVANLNLPTLSGTDWPAKYSSINKVENVKLPDTVSTPHCPVAFVKVVVPDWSSTFIALSETLSGVSPKSKVPKSLSKEFLVLPELIKIFCNEKLIPALLFNAKIKPAKALLFTKAKLNTWLVIPPEGVFVKAWLIFVCVNTFK